ncbi:MAG: DUF4349 domain-containing protein [Chloroflexota bacterium]
MKYRPALLIAIVLVALIVLAACGGAAPAATQAPPMENFAAATEAPVMEAPASVDKSAPQAPDIVAQAAPTSAAFEISNASGENVVVQNSNRKIIKNADVKLLVKDTDVAIDRTTQIIGDLGGYIISSRVWYQDYFGNNLKYSTISIGIPVDQFEQALTRLRGLSIRVLDENATGEDVTDQYVDLQSQVENLEATRARIQEFLKDAKTVDEALRINQQLTDIEGQIEQIKGRMNYLADRSSFSTITVNFEPEFPILTATPTTTPAPTLTPRPTFTSTPWKPGETFKDASHTVTNTYRGLIDFLIWMVVVVIPVLAPFVFIFWLIWRFMTRKLNKPSDKK